MTTINRIPYLLTAPLFGAVTPQCLRIVLAFVRQSCLFISSYRTWAPVLAPHISLLIAPNSIVQYLLPAGGG